MGKECISLRHEVCFFVEIEIGYENEHKEFQAGVKDDDDGVEKKTYLFRCDLSNELIKLATLFRADFIQRILILNIQEFFITLDHS